MDEEVTWEKVEELRQILREFQELVKFPGWDQLANIAESQLKARGNQIMQPSGGIDGAITTEFMKGEASGIRLFMQLPAVAVEDFQEQIDQMVQMLKEAENGD